MGAHDSENRAAHLHQEFIGVFTPLTHVSCCVLLFSDLWSYFSLPGTNYPAKTSVSPRSPPLGTFRENVPSGEERGETDVFAGYEPISTVFTKVVRILYPVRSPQSSFYTLSVFYTQSIFSSPRFIPSPGRYFIYDYYYVPKHTYYYCTI